MAAILFGLMRWRALTQITDSIHRQEMDSTARVEALLGQGCTSRRMNDLHSLSVGRVVRPREDVDLMSGLQAELCMREILFCSFLGPAGTSIYGIH